MLLLSLKSTRDIIGLTETYTTKSGICFHQFMIWPGAIIRDGDRKSWDPRGPMIWDNGRLPFDQKFRNFQNVDKWYGNFLGKSSRKSGNY